MSLTEFKRRAQSIISAVAAVLMAIIRPFIQSTYTKRNWTAMLAAMYPHVADARYAQAALARAFYDAQREIHHPSAGQEPAEDDNPLTFGEPNPFIKVTVEDAQQQAEHPVHLDQYEPDWFENALSGLESLAKGTIQNPDQLGARVISTALREVENGGRRTMQEAVRTDGVVKGWARVQGGEKSCGFCSMLISRGPVYSSASAAGFDGDDEDALRAIRLGDVVDELMDEWHDNCDCRVVPVFDYKIWPGKEEFYTAEKQWVEMLKKTPPPDKKLNDAQRVNYYTYRMTKHLKGANAST